MTNKKLIQMLALLNLMVWGGAALAQEAGGLTGLLKDAQKASPATNAVPVAATPAPATVTVTTPAAPATEAAPVEQNASTPAMVPFAESVPLLSPIRAASRPKSSKGPSSDLRRPRR